MSPKTILTPEGLEARRRKRAEYMRKYYAAHRAEQSARNRAYQKANPEKFREHNKKYRAKNREKVNAYYRAYYQTHKEQYREYRLRAELKKYRKEKEKGNNGNSD